MVNRKLAHYMWVDRGYPSIYVILCVESWDSNILSDWQPIWLGQDFPVAYNQSRATDDM